VNTDDQTLSSLTRKIRQTTQDLTRKLKRLWTVIIKVILTVVGALRTVPKWLEKNFKEIRNNRRRLVTSQSCTPWKSMYTQKGTRF